MRTPPRRYIVEARCAGRNQKSLEALLRVVDPEIDDGAIAGVVTTIRWNSAAPQLVNVIGSMVRLQVELADAASPPVLQAVFRPKEADRVDEVLGRLAAARWRETAVAGMGLGGAADKVLERWKEWRERYGL